MDDEATAALKHFSAALVTDLQRLGPFGQGNRRPVLCCRDVTLAGPARRVAEQCGVGLAVERDAGEAVGEVAGGEERAGRAPLDSGQSSLERRHDQAEPAEDEHEGAE